MNEVYLLLGSNEGGRQLNIKAALKLISTHCGNIVKTSSLYETAPWGFKEQQSFTNQAIMIETQLTPQELLKTLKNIEKESGRQESIQWGPRIIDIDILFYGSEIIDSPVLKIPHPLMQERKFTLVPLNEIAGGFLHPVLKKTVQQLLAECNDDLPVERIA